jgi:LPS export ABC transporter protein LptC
MRTLASTLLILLLAGCGGAGPAVPVVEVEDASPRTFGLNLKLTEEGVLKADLHGDTAFQRPGTEVTEVRGVRLTFVTGDGTRPAELTSLAGEYDAATGVMIARGNVVLITFNERGERRVVRTEELHYDQHSERVWSERETTVEETDRTLISDGFESDTRFTRIEGRNSRTGGVRVRAGEGL